MTLTVGKKFSTLTLVMLLSCVTAAQTVKVKFRYQPQSTYVRVHFPGNFNNWGNNQSGTILATDPSIADSLETATGLWVKTIPLTFSGGGGTTYQYKIYQQLSSTPTNWNWLPDPLNRLVVTSSQNSQFTVDSLVLFELCAYPYTIQTGAGGTNFVVAAARPNLSAGIFQPIGGPPALNISGWVDEDSIADAINFYDAASGIFTYVPVAPMPNGSHVFKLTVTAGNQSKTDSVSFIVRAGTVQILSAPYTTHKTTYTTAGVLMKADGSGPDSSMPPTTISVNGATRSLLVLNGVFSDATPLPTEGQYVIKVYNATGRDSVTVTRVVDHSPNGRSRAVGASGSITLFADSSSDPNGFPITTYKWLDDPAVPLGLNGQTGISASISATLAVGDYYFGLIVTDSAGYADTSRGWFIVNPDGSVRNPVIASHPSWASQARIYFLFPKAASQAGTINAAATLIPYIHQMGFNVIWMMPVMKNAYPIDNDNGPGYNIVDFYNVAPEYGTNNDFKNFVSQAHALGMKVILDVTPNHTSRFHPWSADAHTFHAASPYWPWYEHAEITANTNGLGDCLDADGFNYYCGFSDQLLNFNWKDLDARAEMINVYTYWVKQFGIDGYRFDVYWGPHRRYGEAFMGKPVRDALKHIKPDILLLGEDDGTGVGTEVIYADNTSAGVNAGLDMSYDFNLYFNSIRNFGFGSAGAINSLQSNIDNGGFYPGPNALYMRFMESQDEDRIYYYEITSNNFVPSSYSDPTPAVAFTKTMPMASVLFTVPGVPMIWNGQEVGWGYGISGNKHARDRSIIDWNFQGRQILAPYYQRLALIRSQFPAFTQHKRDTNNDGNVNSADSSDFVRVSCNNSLVYAFSRPFQNQNGLTVANFSSAQQSAVLNLTTVGELLFSGGIQPGASYYINNLSTNSFQLVNGAALDSVSLILPPYGSDVFTVSLTPDSVVIANPVVSVPSGQQLPSGFLLEQNYPNPFNPSTTIRYELSGASHVTLKVFDLLGREVSTLVSKDQAAGRYAVSFSGISLSSGVYLYRLEMQDSNGGSQVSVRKMIFLK